MFKNVMMGDVYDEKMGFSWCHLGWTWVVACLRFPMSHWPQILMVLNSWPASNMI